MQQRCVDVTRSEVTRYRTSYLSTPTPEMHAESVLRAGEELKVLMSSLRLNSSANLRVAAHLPLNGFKPRLIDSACQPRDLNTGALFTKS
jgi:hypothetical protein